MSLLRVLLAVSMASVVECTGMQVILRNVPEECVNNPKSEVGDAISINYIGTIDPSSSSGVANREFDNSYLRETPFKFVIGRGQVILGLDVGVIGMCVGESRTLIIPPDLAYGEEGAGETIPGMATLNFNVTCVDLISAAGEEPNVFVEIDTDANAIITHDEFLAWFATENNGGSPPSGLWESMDKNKDNRIDWDEFDGPKGSTAPSIIEPTFAPSQFSAASNPIESRSSHSSGPNLLKSSSSHSSVQSILDFPNTASSSTSKTATPNVFAIMDTNNDGSVSHVEFNNWFAKQNDGNGGIPPIDLWEKLDKNNDSVITWDEFSGPKGASSSSAYVSSIDFRTTNGASTSHADTTRTVMIDSAQAKNTLERLHRHSVHGDPDIDSKVQMDFGRTMSDREVALSMLSGARTSRRFPRGETHYDSNGFLRDSATGQPRVFVPNFDPRNPLQSVADQVKSERLHPDFKAIHDGGLSDQRLHELHPEQQIDLAN